MSACGLLTVEAMGEVRLGVVDDGPMNLFRVLIESMMALPLLGPGPAGETTSML